ncbi:MAG: hypothetical protein EOP48_08895 [Sphingobacteriales bacterium]|jgi:hypothetical protein|nr:MAG: hypothetical protein EOP48_08895 [Sphingobacteriales bacterium]
MKNIAFALLVFGIPVLFPIYLVAELSGGSKTNDQTITDHHAKVASVPVALTSEKRIETSFPF